MDAIDCQQCGGTMERTKKIERNFGLQLAGVFVFLAGVVLLFFFPLGTFAGLAIMIVAANMGYKRRKVWKCLQCGYFFERA